MSGDSSANRLSHMEANFKAEPRDRRAGLDFSFRLVNVGLLHVQVRVGGGGLEGECLDSNGADHTRAQSEGLMRVKTGPGDAM